jgi:hypothetical protein
MRKRGIVIRGYRLRYRMTKRVPQIDSRFSKEMLEVVCCKIAPSDAKNGSEPV